MLERGRERPNVLNLSNSIIFIVIIICMGQKQIEFCQT